MLHLSTVDTSTYGLLQELFKIPFIKNNFALAGGTALALQIGHRKSIDLDFFSNEEFDVKELEIILNTNKHVRFQDIGNNTRMLFGFINEIKCDFVHEPSSHLRPIHEMDGVHYYSIEDIAAMKLHTICGRGKKKDFFDVYVLLHLYKWNNLLDWFVNKYDRNQLFFLWRSILYFEDAEHDPEIVDFPPYNKSWDEIKNYIYTNCSK